MVKLDRHPVNKAPDAAGKAAKLFLDFNEGQGIGDGGFDFKAITDDAFILHKTFHIFCVHLAHFANIKILKSFPVILPALEDCGPAQTCLGPFENQEFKQDLIVMNGLTPLLIMISAENCPTTVVLGLDFKSEFCLIRK
jgi:hypothetical protein